MSPMRDSNGTSPESWPRSDAELMGGDALTIADLRARLAASEEERERLREALRYISTPTMGRPGDADPEAFAVDGATERNARLALATCIRTARAALSSSGSEGVREHPVERAGGTPDAPSTLSSSGTCPTCGYRREALGSDHRGMACPDLFHSQSL